MQNDLISREALIEYGEEHAISDIVPDWENLSLSVKNGICKYAQGFRKMVEQFPAVEAEPVRHGRWIGTQYDGYADGCPVYDLWECSECREEFESEGDPPNYRYCPDCGAKMN